MIIQTQSLEIDSVFVTEAHLKNHFPSLCCKEHLAQILEALAKRSSARDHRKYCPRSLQPPEKLSKGRRVRNLPNFIVVSLFGL
ncbi:uncharacterized protein H6S33_010894 [Morchella sextelata]|uniref:uncharacterized protein n=1 Tax=Morchella sextelata TaxID=1174677 RepID=UPI001D04FBAB|nr:uncharacterized protein H6S33_010894 [Morchella sextelata]KAH0611629.1 hypothetical protein H6S33_010894 [Morchella sextelata]